MPKTGMILETGRLYLRRLELSDYDALCRILQDDETMYAYEGAFSSEEVREWLSRQLRRYEEHGFGLWAVILKDTGRMIGQCGLTIQPWKDREVLEIGYLFERPYWHKGYAAEAARACRRYAFDVLGAEEVCSIIRDTNIPSQKVALRNGMRKADTWTKHYRGVDMPHFLYISRRQGDPAAAADIPEVNIYGANRFEQCTKTRSASRAVIIKDGSILLSHEVRAGQYMIPGGGIEEGETPDECCIREAEEETGLIVNPVRLFLVLNEFYEEYRYISYYYVCEPAAEGSARLTPAEVEAGLVPEWMPLSDAAAIFSRHQDYALDNEERRGMYLREYTALCEYGKTQPDLQICPHNSEARPGSGCPGGRSFSIRTAVPEDEERIRELFLEMLRTIYRTDDVQGYEPGYLDKYWRGGEDRIYVSGRPADAFLSVEVHREPEEYIYLDDLSVTEASRGRGTGSALIREAEAYADRLGIKRICFHVEKSNQSAFRLYRRLGYSAIRDDGSRYLMGKER